MSLFMFIDLMNTNRKKLQFSKEKLTAPAQRDFYDTNLLNTIGYAISDVRSKTSRSINNKIHNWIIILIVSIKWRNNFFFWIKSPRSMI